MTVTTSAPASGPPAADLPGRRRRRRPGTWRGSRHMGPTATLLLSPTLLVLGMIAGYPVLAALRLSFVQTAERVAPDTGKLTSTEWLGTGNYTAIFHGERSEERRVGKECRSRWSPDHSKKKTKQA